MCCVGSGALEDAGIPYTPAVGAIFLLVDLRKALDQPTWAVRALLASSLCRQTETDAAISAKQLPIHLFLLHSREECPPLIRAGRGEALAGFCQPGRPGHAWWAHALDPCGAACPRSCTRTCPRGVRPAQTPCFYIFVTYSLIPAQARTATLPSRGTSASATQLRRWRPSWLASRACAAT